MAKKDSQEFNEFGFEKNLTCPLDNLSLENLLYE